MSHVTTNKQRADNNAIRNCPHRRVREFKEVIHQDLYGEESSEYEWVETNECGPMKTLSAAQDQCIRCQKVFTY